MQATAGYTGIWQHVRAQPEKTGKKWSSARLNIKRAGGAALTGWGGMRPEMAPGRGSVRVFVLNSAPLAGCSAHVGCGLHGGAAPRPRFARRRAHGGGAIRPRPPFWGAASGDGLGPHPSRKKKLPRSPGASLPDGCHGYGDAKPAAATGEAIRSEMGLGTP